MKYLMGIDLGTSGMKTVLFDETGKKISLATAEYPLKQPQNGWAEQDPNHWWKACIATVSEVINKSNIDSSNIAGIGLSGQMHGLVLLDECGEVLRDSILWCDGRTTVECEEITNLVGPEKLIEITANPALPGFTAGKILWVRKNEPEIYAKTRHILLPKDYLRYKLTGIFATEVSDASGMNLLDVTKRQWSKEVLDILDIDESLLAKMYESYEITGKVTHEVAELTGLAVDTLVVGGAGDNAAAAIGTGVVKDGSAFITLGTSGVIFAHSSRVTIDPQGRVHTFCSAVPGAWTVMSCTLSAGGSLQWYRNNFCEKEELIAQEKEVDVYEILDDMAKEVPIGSNRLLFLPYLMGERSPILNAEARGVFFGLSGMHQQKHLIRSLVEGVSFSQRQCLDVFKEMAVSFEEIIATGGGGKSSFWRQMLADVLNCPIVTGVDSEGPALGVAILAGVGAGVYQDVESACEMIIQKGDIQLPNKDNQEVYMSYYALYQKLYKQLVEPFSALASLK